MPETAACTAAGSRATAAEMIEVEKRIVKRSESAEKNRRDASFYTVLCGYVSSLGDGDE